MVKKIKAGKRPPEKFGIVTLLCSRSHPLFALPYSDVGTGEEAEAGLLEMARTKMVGSGLVPPGCPRCGSLSRDWRAEAGGLIYDSEAEVRLAFERLHERIRRETMGAPGRN